MMIALVLVIGTVAVTQQIVTTVLEYNRRDEQGRRKYGR